MKKTEISEIKNLGLEVIKEKIKSAKKELTDLVIDKNMKKLKDVKSVFKKRKEIARLSTILKQKELLAELEQRKEDL